MLGVKYNRKTTRSGRQGRFPGKSGVGGKAWGVKRLGWGRRRGQVWCSWCGEPRTPSSAATLQKLQESAHDDKPRRQVTGPQSPRRQLGIYLQWEPIEGVNVGVVGFLPGLETTWEAAAG